MANTVKAIWYALTGNKSAAVGALINPSTYRTQGLYYFGADGREHHFCFGERDSSLNAYLKCPPLSAIINRKTTAFLTGKNFIIKSKGKGKNDEAKGEIANKIRALQNHPNPLQNALQFEAQAYIMQQLYEYAIIFIDKPFGMPAYEATRMWVLPNWMVTLYQEDKLFMQMDDNSKGLRGAELNYNGKIYPLPVENIYLLKGVSASTSSMLVPTNRIQAHELPISNIIGAYESEGAIIDHRGPSVLVSSDKTDADGKASLSPAEEKAVREQWKKHYGWKKNQSGAFITAANIKITPVGFDVKQLGLHEAITNGAKSLCDAWGYPAYLMGLIDPTYNNQQGAQRGLYMDTLIPEAESWAEQWSIIFEAEKNNLTLIKDYSHVHALQENFQQMAVARKTNTEAFERMFKNNTITLGRFMELMDEDKRGDKFDDMLYFELLKLGWQFGDSAKPVTDPNATDNNLMQAV